MNIEQIETYIKYLDSQGLDMKPVWAQYRELVERERTAQPDVLDLQYICPCVQPTISEHVWRGQKQVLSPTNIFKGYSYTLSPGQRQWLRDNYGMTPTETVTILDLGIWPGNHPKSIILRSDEHVDPKRRHVLIKVSINRPGKFFHEAQLLDSLIEQMKPRRATVSKIVSTNVVSVMCEGMEIAKVRTDITKLMVGDEVMVAWSEKEDPTTREMVDQWKVTKHLTAAWAGVSSGKRTSPAVKAPSLDSLLAELSAI